MSNKERLIQVAGMMPEEQVSAALLMLYGLLHEQAEAEDDAFCIALNDAFLDNPDKGELIDFEDACKMLGVQLP